MIKALVSWTVKLMILGLAMMGVMAMMSPASKASGSVDHVLMLNAASDDIDDTPDKHSRETRTPSVDSHVESRNSNVAAKLHRTSKHRKVNKSQKLDGNKNQSWNAAGMKDLIAASMPNMYLHLASKLRAAMNKIHAPIF
jgi:hypothetical protein